MASLQACLTRIRDLRVVSQPGFDLVYRPFIVFRRIAEPDNIRLAGGQRSQMVIPQKPSCDGVGGTFVALCETVIHENAMK
jgi:hypothetical protein